MVSTSENAVALTSWHQTGFTWNENRKCVRILHFPCVRAREIHVLVSVCKGSDMSVSDASASPDALGGLSLPERVALLRRRMAEVPSRGESASERIEHHETQPVEERSTASSPKAAGRTRSVLPVPEVIAGVLPHGGLVRGTVVSVSGAGSLLLGVVAAVTSAGGHVAVIGLPRFGVLAAVEMGAQLNKLALIPDPGSDPVEVAAILLDGVDLVVLGLGGESVAPTRARAVVARARSKGATLLVTDGRWDGAELRLEASVHGYDGLGSGRELGRGRLRSIRLSVSARGKAMRTRTVRLDLRSVGGRVEWFADERDAVPLSLPVAVST